MRPVLAVLSSVATVAVGARRAFARSGAAPIGTGADVLDTRIGHGGGATSAGRSRSAILRAAARVSPA